MTRITIASLLIAALSAACDATPTAPQPRVSTDSTIVEPILPEPEPEVRPSVEGTWEGPVEIEGKQLVFSARLRQRGRAIAGGGKLTGRDYVCVHDLTGQRKKASVVLELSCIGYRAGGEAQARITSAVRLSSKGGVPDESQAWSVVLELDVDDSGRTLIGSVAGAERGSSSVRLEKR